jgi:electron transport complex protein RnfE
MGLGFTLALLCMGAVREILGSGSLFGLALFSENFQPWVIMILPGGGFFTLGVWLLLINHLKLRRAQATEILAEQT